MIRRTLLGFIPTSLAFALIQPAGAALGAEPPPPPTLKITRLLPRLPADQLTRGRRIHVEGEAMPEGYMIENSWLILKEAGASDTAPLYRCDFDSGNGSTLSRGTSRPGMTGHEMIGYICTKPGPGRVELRSVNPKGTPGKGYFVTDFTNCEGDAYREDEFLGYAYRSIPYEIAISVSPATIAPGDALEISWKTTYVPDGQEGRENEFPERILGLTLSPAAVSGAFIDEDGNITGTPKTDPFAKHVPLSGSIVWNSSRSLSDEYAQKLLPGEYQIQFALFPKCFYSGASPCDWHLDDILFTASDVFTVVGPVGRSSLTSAPSDLTATCGAHGAATFTWAAPADNPPPRYSIRIQDKATEEIVDHKDDITTTSYNTSLVPGRTYNWWVHSQYAGGQSPHAVAGSPVSCP